GADGVGFGTPGGVAASSSPSNIPADQTGSAPKPRASDGLRCSAEPGGQPCTRGRMIVRGASTNRGGFAVWTAREKAISWGQSSQSGLRPCLPSFLPFKDLRGAPAGDPFCG